MMVKSNLCPSLCFACPLMQFRLRRWQRLWMGEYFLVHPTVFCTKFNTITVGCTVDRVEKKIIQFHWWIIWFLRLFKMFLEKMVNSFFFKFYKFFLFGIKKTFIILEAIAQMTVDESRHILYCRSDVGSLQVLKIIAITFTFKFFKLKWILCYSSK